MKANELMIIGHLKDSAASKEEFMQNLAALNVGEISAEAIEKLEGGAVKRQIIKPTYGIIWKPSPDPIVIKI
ncbi:hypothetical protein [Dyadobacter sp. NIV53]|uniref:hypothetical protein n=1 Tax=Dyadobacter sp. NIV53 TaxID=2861765 RepID=UPI001C886ED8|nr:hypothetical protein [Dyadobacter sp. NIV53]